MKLRITVEGNSYEVDVEVLDGDLRSSVATQVAPPPQRPASPPARQPVVAPATPPAVEKVCKAPIPGSIFRVNVAAGQAVRAGETVLVLEAMKMETPIASPVDGRVKVGHVDVGTAVKQGQILVEFE